MAKWLESHTGILITVVLLVLAVGSIVASIIGWAVGDDRLAENGWVLALIVALFGLAIRAGYNIGRRARLERIEADLDELRSRTESTDAQMVAVHSTVVDIRNMVANLDPRVRPFPQRGRES